MMRLLDMKPMRPGVKLNSRPGRTLLSGLHTQQAELECNRIKMERAFEAE